MRIVLVIWFYVLRHLSASQMEGNQIFIFLISMLSAGCWFVVYLRAILLGFRNKSYYIPMPLICLNLGWEFLGGIDASNYEPLWRWLCLSASLMDFCIFLTAFFYGRGMQPKPLQPYIQPMLCLGLVYLTGMQFLFAHFQEGLHPGVSQRLAGGAPPEGAPYVSLYSIVLAYIINLFMSWQFFVDGGTPGQGQLPSDKWIAVCKMVGTAVVLPIVLLMNPAGLDKDMILFLGGMTVGCAVLDGAYLVLITRRNALETVLSPTRTGAAASSRLRSASEP